MSKLLDSLAERATHMCRFDEFDRAPIVFDEVPKEVTFDEIRRKEGYEVTLTVGARFWANRAEYQEALNIARLQLVRLLYNEVLFELDGIAHAVMDGDRSAAMNRINALRGSLTK